MKMKMLQMVSRGGHFAMKVLRTQRAQGAHAPASRTLLQVQVVVTHRCFAVRAQPQRPPSPTSSSDDDDGTKSSSVSVNNADVLRYTSENGDVDSSSSSNPWRHFQAFSGMDEYMDVTLIHYENKRELGGVAAKEPYDSSQAPSATQKRSTKED